MNETDYMRGRRAVWQSLLGQCLRELGVDDPVAMSARWASEREAAVAQLRMLCEEHGDNEWDENLHLADIIDKHLGCYFGE